MKATPVDNLDDSGKHYVFSKGEILDDVNEKLLKYSRRRRLIEEKTRSAGLVRWMLGGGG